MFCWTRTTLPILARRGVEPCSECDVSCICALRLLLYVQITSDLFLLLSEVCAGTEVVKLEGYISTGSSSHQVSAGSVLYSRYLYPQ